MTILPEKVKGNLLYGVQQCVRDELYGITERRPTARDRDRKTDWALSLLVLGFYNK